MAREFESLALLDHPYVVKVIDAGIAIDVSCLAVELIDGVDVERLLDLVTEEPLELVVDLQPRGSP